MDPQNREPLTEDIREENNINNTETGSAGDAGVTDSKRSVTGHVPVYAERAETKMPETDPDELKALALAYARYLTSHGMAPGEPTFTDSETEEPVVPEAVIAEGGDKDEPARDNEQPDKKPSRKAGAKPAAGGRKVFISEEPSAQEIRKIAAELDKSKSGYARIGSVMDLHDKVQTKIDTAGRNAGRDFVASLHKIVSTYRNSRRVIGAAILIIGILAAVVLAIFDRFTVYEYAYNGKTLGYVAKQEDVTEVLDIAGKMLTENSSGSTEIRFIANQNVTFKRVDARGKSTDDADIAVNKLVYMTDIETEAFGVYDGQELAAIVKSSEDAEELLLQTRDYLSTPDEGMKLVSAVFTNDLDIRPINVLLTSVQSNYDAMQQMTGGGKMEIYHIVEEGETLEGLSAAFGVDPVNIFNEDNSEPVTEILQGDKVCIHEEVEPVSVEMVEKGKMKEVVEYETIKKESDKYYKGDTYTKQEGVNGEQIFEGTLTKVSGEVTDRDGTTTVRKKKKDKIILVGTAERPKTAPTGTYAMPIQHYTLSSGFGYRWGRLHSGIDMAAPTGTPIYASDGGTIQRAGWYAGYGLCVEVYHENGRMTRYGHCSKLLVNVGDKVYQGQNIALVGNTGHSFGSHLHFEINLNGSPVNPRPYLGI